MYKNCMGTILEVLPENIVYHYAWLFEFSLESVNVKMLRRKLGFTIMSFLNRYSTVLLTAFLYSEEYGMFTLFSLFALILSVHPPPPPPPFTLFTHSLHSFICVPIPSFLPSVIIQVYWIWYFSMWYNWMRLLWY